MAEVRRAEDLEGDPRYIAWALRESSRGRQRSAVAGWIAPGLIAFVLAWTAAFGPAHEVGHAISATLLGVPWRDMQWARISVTMVGDWRDNIVLAAGAVSELLIAGGLMILFAKKGSKTATSFTAGWMFGCWLYSFHLDEWRDISYGSGTHQILWFWAGLAVMYAAAILAGKYWEEAKQKR